MSADNEATPAEFSVFSNIKVTMMSSKLGRLAVTNDVIRVRGAATTT